MTADLLARARSGDGAAFDALAAPLRPALHVHCYRMLGSLADADDAVQETLIAAWDGLPGFRGDAALSTWLHRIATTRCLNLIRGRARRPPPVPQPPFDPPPPSRLGVVPWLQPYPDEVLDPEGRLLLRESVELAFVTALQTLPPRQTAVLVLRDVLGLSTEEAAETLGTSAVAVKAALQRARARVAVPDRSAVDDAAEGRTAARFARCLTDGDVEGLIGLLTEDAWLAMPPAPHEYLGRDAVAGFLRASGRWRRDREVRVRPTRANGRPALVEYLAAAPGGPLRAVAVVVLDCDASGVRGITRFLDGGLAARFGLPAALD